jgi:phage terminase large subunit
MELTCTEVFKRNNESTKRIVINRGGSRSSKTYSLIQLFVIRALTEKNKRIIIARESLAIAKKTIYKEFIDFLIMHNLYSLFLHNKSECYFICKSTKTTIDFIGCDDPQKIRGLQSNYFWLEEADGIEYEFFKQFMLRLTCTSNDNKINQMFISFNPSSSDSWIKTIEEQRDDVDIIVSTFRDNPFLTEESVREIEYLKEIDMDSYLVYGEGQYGQLRGAIFDNFKTFTKFSDFEDYEWRAFGIDFGFVSDPTAIVELYKKGENIYLIERCYSKGMTTTDIDKVLTEISEKNEDIIADSAEPRLIAELQSKRHNIKGVKKVSGDNRVSSIVYGINTMKRYKIHIYFRSVNLLMEFNNYQFKTDINGNVLNVPIDKHNHLIDAIRYIFMEKLGIEQKKTGFKSYKI